MSEANEAIPQDLWGIDNGILKGCRNLLINRVFRHASSVQYIFYHYTWGIASFHSAHPQATFLNSFGIGLHGRNRDQGRAVLDYEPLTIKVINPLTDIPLLHRFEYLGSTRITLAKIPIYPDNNSIAACRQWSVAVGI